MKDFIKAMDSLSDLVKLLLCLPIVNIVWGIYRVARSADANNVTGIVLGIIWIIFGGIILWVFDLVYMIMNKKIWWFC